MSDEPRIALVTGGGRGIGRAIALALSEVGMQIAVAARSAGELSETVALIARSGGSARSFVLDVTDGPAVERTVEQIERTVGPVELLVNAAGRHRGVGPIWEMDPLDWWRDVEVNLRGPYLCARAVQRSMRERMSGRIITVSSSAGNFPAPYMSAYGCSKSAVQNLTESLHAELHPFGVAVFALDPGLVWTAMSSGVIGSEACRRWMPELSCLGQKDCVPPELAADQAVRLASGAYDMLSGRFVTYRTDLRELVERRDEIKRDDLYVMRLRGLRA